MEISTEQSATDQTFLRTRVLLFAILRDVLKRDEIEVMISDHAPTVSELLDACAEQYPSLAPWLPHIRVAVDCQYSGPETLLTPGVEIAFIPPVAGG